MDWNAYVGIPYVPRGRDRAGVDCWGLVRLFYRDQYRIDLPGGAPDYDPANGAGVARLFTGPERDEWRLTDAPEPGDLVMLRVLGYPSHVGILTAPGHMLHAREGYAVTIERLDTGAWRHRIDGYYRHAQRSAVTLCGRPHALRTASLSGIAPEGATLLEMIRIECARARVPDALVCANGHAWIDGEYISAAEWANYRPHRGQRVEYRLLAAGGGALRSVLTLVLVVAAIVFQQYYLLPTLTAAGFGGVVAGTLTLGGTALLAAGTAAFMFAGTMLINAIAPIRPPSGGDQSAIKSKYRLQGGANQAVPYGVIPVVLGQHRFTPPLAAQIYTFSESAENHLAMAVCWGYGPLDVADIRIGDTPVGRFEDVVQAHLHGTSGESTALFKTVYGNQDVSQESINVKLERKFSSGSTLEAVTWVQRTVSQNVDHIKMEFSFPAGCWQTPTEGKNAGRVDVVTVKVNVQVRQVGTGPWAEVAQTIYGKDITLRPCYEIIDNSITQNGTSDIGDWWLLTYGGTKINLGEHTVIPLWRWSLISLDAYNKLIVRDGCETDSQYGNPSARLRQLMEENNTGLQVSYDRLPTLPGGEEAIAYVCVYNTAIVATVDLRDADITGCAVTYTGLAATVANGTVVRAEQETLVVTKATKEAFDVSVWFDIPNGQYDVQVALTTASATEGTHANGLETDGDNDTALYRDCYWTTLTGYTDTKPIVQPKPLALSAFRIKASNQINGTVDGITGTVKSICPDWAYGTNRTLTNVARTSNVVTITTPVAHGYVVGHVVDVTATTNTGVNGTSLTLTAVPTTTTFTYTKTGADIASSADTGPVVAVGGGTWILRHARNPASLFRYVLQHPGNAVALPDASIDLTKIQKWHNYCKSQGFTFDAVVVQQRPLLDVLRDIAAAGRASPTLVDGKWSVIIDDIKNTIVQHFTPHNSWGFEGTRILPKRPHALRIRFFNRAKGYQPDERLVYDDGYSISNATLIEQVELPGVTTEQNVHMFGRFHLAQMTLRPDRYALNVDMEHLICTRGDKVRVTHETPLWGLGSGRIRALTIDGSSNLTAITLDESLPMKAATSYTVRIRKQTGASVAYTLATVGSDDDYSTLTFASPIAPGHGINVNDLVLFGALDAESVELLVQSIEPDSKGNARLTLVDYAPAIFNADEEAIPAWSSQITLPPRLLQDRIGTNATPIIDATRIQADEAALTRTGAGNLQCGIRVPFTVQTRLPVGVTHVEAQYSLSTGTAQWRAVPPVPLGSRVVLITGLKELASYYVRLRYVSAGGLVGKWVQTGAIFVTGRTKPPKAVTGIKVKYADSIGLTIDWDDCPDIDFKIYSVRRIAGIIASWAGGTPVKNTTVSEYRIGFPAPGTAQTYMVKSIDVLGNEATAVASVVVDIDAPLLTNFRAASVIDNNVQLAWTLTQTTFPIRAVELRKGGTSWSNATLIGTKSGSFTILSELAAGTYTYRAKAIDAGNNYSVESIISVKVNKPKDFINVATFSGTLA